MRIDVFTIFPHLIEGFASQALLDPAVKDNPSVYPPADVMAKLFTISPYGPKEQRVLNRVWTQIKTGS